MSSVTLFAFFEKVFILLPVYDLILDLVLELVLDLDLDGSQTTYFSKCFLNCSICDRSQERTAKDMIFISSYFQTFLASSDAKIIRKMFNNKKPNW